MDDLFGIKPVSKAFDKITSATIDSAKSFLNSVCKPALEVSVQKRIW